MLRENCNRCSIEDTTPQIFYFRVCYCNTAVGRVGKRPPVIRSNETIRQPMDHDHPARRYSQLNRPRPVGNCRIRDVQGEMIGAVWFSPINDIISFRRPSVALTLLWTNRISTETNAIRFNGIFSFQQSHFTKPLIDYNFVGDKTFWRGTQQRQRILACQLSDCRKILRG